MSGLQIPNSRERAIVHAADVVLRPLGWFRRRAPDRPVGRVLLLRLERIGDLLMVLDAIADARAAWPDAEIDSGSGIVESADCSAHSRHPNDPDGGRPVAGARRRRRWLVHARRQGALLAEL
jgi:hypothetical protein